jgi:tetratricopeptide (TPR) repeat protein
MARNNLAWARAGHEAAALVARAFHQYQAKQFDDAIRTSQEALHQLPTSAAAANNLCASLNAAERWQEAVLACTQAAAMHPEHELLRNNLAWARNGAAVSELTRRALDAYRAKKFGAVVQLSKAALAIDSRSAAAWNNQCAALCELKQWRDALPICEQAVAVAPDSATAKANLAWARSGAVRK